MYHIVWEYEVRADRLAEFEALYGPAGAWSRLFRPAGGYIGTELYRDTVRPTHFVSLDRWTSHEAFEAYLPTVGEAYRQLDEEGSALTTEESRVGAFES
jgi:heme-degrading monooxygenase HmoA